MLAFSKATRSCRRIYTSEPLTYTRRVLAEWAKSSSVQPAARVRTSFLTLRLSLVYNLRECHYAFELSFRLIKRQAQLVIYIDTNCRYLYVGALAERANAAGGTQQAQARVSAVARSMGHGKEAESC